MPDCLRHIAAPALVALALASCAPDSNTLESESRAITVEENAIPASAAGGAAAAADVTHLLPATGPTYVTLTISANKGQSSDEKNQRPTAIASGSGYVVDPSGYVMTAAHVGSAKGNAVSARAANGRIYSGEVVGINPDNDMALIKLKGFSGRATQPASPGCVAKGDLVFTLGKPHSQGDLARVGTLEARHFGRAVAYGKFGYPDAIVLRMGTQKGESGGPVFDGKGRLIGMVVSTLSDQNGNSINLAHAIPSTALASFLCRNISCPADWATLSSQSPDNCNGV